MKGFTLIEVLIATAIVGFSFGAFLVMAGKIVDSSDLLLKTVISALAAHNGLNEAVYGGKDLNGEEVEILRYKLLLTQDFEELMGYRVVKVGAGTPDRGKLVELYEVR
ncbi:prepilin-type N-terminal cleavage/methylation domain-containing protein [Thermovibrio sp.]